jgi:hypothetical protein
MISNFVSVYTVIEKLYRDLGTNYELNESDIISWCAEALNTIGAYSQYEEISDCLLLKNGKSILPCNFYKLVDIRWKGKPIYWSTNTNRSNYQCHNCRIPVVHQDNSEHNNSSPYTFYINNSYIITNINDHDNMEANLCMVYLGIRTDELGYPLIPDDIYYSKALAAYVTSMIDYQDWRKGKIADKIKDKSEADWLFYVNSARGAANMPNTAMLESIKNSMLRLKSDPNAYRNGFKNRNTPENLNL